MSTEQAIATTGLRDIHGLDPISLFPLALGWWLVIGGVVLLLIAAIWGIWHWRKPATTQHDASWQTVAKHTWQRIAAQAETPREQLTQSAELLRWVVMQRYGRETVAGLTGQAWLQWLQTHDPAGFAWQTEGQLLVEMAYSPPTEQPDSATVQLIYQAVAHWLD